MLITGIKSRPVYDTLVPFPAGALHLVVGQGSGGRAMLRLLSEMPDSLARTDILYSTESFSGVNLIADLEASGAAAIRGFTSNAELVRGLHELLQKARMGTRLYVAGSESFIGSVMQVASSFNMNADEVLREHCGTFVRRVFCVHCNTFNENVTMRVSQCMGCGIDLVVRDHYSRRLAAFMGVKADAEVPGELPPVEMLDT
ncbi:MAG: dimethylamine monooxygenase subunit DmmA family protein [Hyphomicrobium sp.]